MEDDNFEEDRFEDEEQEAKSRDFQIELTQKKGEIHSLKNDIVEAKKAVESFKLENEHLKDQLQDQSSEDLRISKINDKLSTAVQKINELESEAEHKNG